MNWPNDADGDVLKSLEKDGFDFSKDHEIDFNIDFKHWPLSKKESEHIKSLYPHCEFIDPDEEDIENGALIGYVKFTVTSKLTYEFVISTQESVTNNMQQYGGWCESWGLWSK